MKGKAILKPGREKPVRNRHPWVFSGAIQRIDGPVDDGDLVRVTDSRGRYLATGYLNRHSQIVVRLLTWDPEEKVDRGFWQRRLAQASKGRASYLGPRSIGHQDPGATSTYYLIRSAAIAMGGGEN